MADQKKPALTFVTPDALPTPPEPVKEGWEFSDEALTEWNAEVQTNTDTPIARAWDRLRVRGILVGSPLGEVYALNEKVLKQRFSHATASFLNEAGNYNQAVEFHDARGIVGTESGL